MQQAGTLWFLPGDDQIMSLDNPARCSLTTRIDWYVQGVPEPASWTMMIAGFGAVGAAARRRRAMAAC